MSVKPREDHDPLGRLHDENGRVTLQYDGSNLITEQTAGGIARRYVFGPGTDEPIVWYEGAGLTDKRWLVADERGSIVAVTDTAGNPLAINRYDESGIPASTNMGRFQYTGQKWLPDFGLYDYKARAYSPTLGRFLQADPIGYGDGMNMYAYAANDPINNTDPTGQFIFKAIGIAKLLKVALGIGKAAKVIKVAKVAKVATKVLANGEIVVTGSKLKAAAAAKAAFAKAAAAKAAAASGGSNPTRVRPGKGRTPCQQALIEPGPIDVSAASADLTLGVGMTGSMGTFRNIITGTTGSFYSFGFAAGGSAGVDLQVGRFRSLGDFVGWADNVSASGPGFGGFLSGIAGSASTSVATGEVIGGTGGGGVGLKWGLQGSMTDTAIYNCTIGG